MLRIKGVGEAKFNKYGEPFLELLRVYASEHGVTPQQEEGRAKKDDKTPSHLVSYNLYRSGLEVAEVFKEREYSRCQCKITSYALQMKGMRSIGMRSFQRV